ncbi:hypothetical protein V2J52_16455 [Georgenia sp. MJ173]|uniref:hypothetical protein n=1 Tax=Georgenia sunbinii TaxID=3117728 RepID=UPI002F269D22
MADVSRAAELWRRWVDEGVIRPGDYDTDLLDAVNPLVAPGTSLTVPDVGAALEESAASARDLIRAVVPLISSFAGMMRDLLDLYARVGATQATGGNLRIQYEFEDGNVVDDSLAAFRTQVETVEEAARRLPWLVFPRSRAFESPLRRLERVETELSRAVTSLDNDVVWADDDAVAHPGTTGLPEVDAVIDDWWHLAVTCRDVLRSVADDPFSVPTPRDDAPQIQVDLAQAATDHWPASQMKAVHGLAEVSRQGSPPAPGKLQATARWLDRFWVESPADEMAAALADVLSLPSWGRRHELYAAWVLTQLDAALPGRLEIDVVDGAIRFPFSATRIATLDVAGDDGGPRRVELWSELRSAADDLAGEGRTNAIQPDYVFLDPAAGAPAGAVLAVEVKQYLRSALRNPGLALRDYAHSLPSATVLLVAHGPLSPRVTTLTREEDVDRVAAFAHVRPTVGSRCESFRAAVTGVLPPPPPPPPPSQPSDAARPLSGTAVPGVVADTDGIRFSLRWDPAVHDLDLHARRLATDERISFINLRESWGRLERDTRDGGPEELTLLPTPGGIDLTVQVYSGAESVVQATATLDVTAEASTVRLIPAAGTGREWHVGHLRPDGSFVPGVQTVTRLGAVES